MLQPESVVLIVGFPRSGTTLVRRALDGHPALSAYPAEAYFLLKLYENFKRRTITEQRALRFFSEQELKIPNSTVKKVIVRAFHNRSTHTLQSLLPKILLGFSDSQCTSATPTVKLTPMVNRLDVAEFLFPEVRVIHVIRDPRGVVASHVNRWPNHNRLWYRIMGWKRAIAAGRAWGEDHSDRYQELFFERLLRDPKREMHSLCTFLDIPYTDAMCQLSFVTQQFTSEAPGTPHLHRFKGFDDRKIDQWKNTLDRHQTRLVETLCTREMMHLDYQEHNPAVTPRKYMAYYCTERLHYMLSSIRDGLVSLWAPVANVVLSERQ